MTWLLRCALVALIVVAIGWKLESPPEIRRAGDAVANLAAVLQGRLAGPIKSEPWGGPDNQSLILTAPIKGCPSPLTVVTVQPSFTSATALEQLLQPGDRRLFAFLDWLSDNPDRWSLLRRRYEDKFDNLLGRSPYVASDTMMFIVEPSGCRIARTVPWRRFWTAR